MSKKLYQVSKEQIKTLGYIMNHSSLIKDPEQNGEDIIIEAWNHIIISRCGSPETFRVDIKCEVRRDGKKRVLERKENGKKISVTSKKREWH